MTKITNLQDLQAEKARLRLLIGKKEEQLEESWDYLKDNYKGMVWEQINPVKNGKIMSMLANFITPGMLPVITELISGAVKGNPLNAKVISASAKYVIASNGLKWLKGFIGKKQRGEEHEQA